ncbi:type VII secretion-associated serine protease mycosin [Streptomyces sp. NPDC006743]|uniref:type VII secretion-associated serine protease mycosin n=1 Tax=Streptomyces sp. NPDC006743 TaxID=3154480 RepID=UPI003455AA7F
MACAALGLLLVGGTAAEARADTTRSQQWFLDAMHAEDMWRASTGSGVTVAVIDTGVGLENPDLKGRVLDGKDLASQRGGDEHSDYDGHGTGMAGLIAGTGAYNGGKGAFGLAPGVKILPIRMPAQSDINGFAGPAYFSKAIRYAADSGARVINISMGARLGSPQLTAAVKYALARGSLIFAAVGNDGDKGNPVEYPAATPGVVGVAAVGKDLRRTAESEYGSQTDMAAPGAELVHACGGKTGLCKSHGTSGATALASASAALIWAKHPDWTNNQVLRVMLNTIGGPTDGAKRNDSIGYGIVRPRIALENPGDPGPADVYPLPDLAAAASPSPTATATAPGAKGAGGADDTSSARGEAGASAGSADGDGDGPLWLGIGLAAVVVIGGAAAAFVLARKRRLSGAKVSREAAAAAASRYLNTVAYPDRAGSVTVLPEAGTEFAYGWAFRFEFREHSGARTQANPQSDYVIVVPHSGAAPHFPPPDIPTAQYMELCAGNGRHPAV